MDNEKILNLMTKDEFDDPESDIDICCENIAEFLDNLFKDDE